MKKNQTGKRKRLTQSDLKKKVLLFFFPSANAHRPPHFPVLKKGAKCIICSRYGRSRRQCCQRSARSIHSTVCQTSQHNMPDLWVKIILHVEQQINSEIKMYAHSKKIFKCQIDFEYAIFVVSGWGMFQVATPARRSRKEAFPSALQFARKTPPLPSHKRGLKALPPLMP